MPTLTGTPVIPLRHKDYLLDVPGYKYHLPNGHTVVYRLRVQPGEYGYDRQARDYFFHDKYVVEILPRRRVSRISEEELSVQVDAAIIKNRIADLLVDVGVSVTTEVAEEIARLTGSSLRTVRRVQADLGALFNDNGEVEETAS